MTQNISHNTIFTTYTTTTMSNLPDVPEELTAEITSKSYHDRYDQATFDFYKLCLDKIKLGKFPCSVNTEDIPDRIISPAISKLQQAGTHINLLINKLIDQSNIRITN